MQGGGDGGRVVDFLQLTHNTGTSVEGSATFLPGDMHEFKVVWVILYTYKYPTLCSRCLFALHSDYYEHRKLFIVKYGMLSGFAFWQISKP